MTSFTSLCKICVLLPIWFCATNAANILGIFMFPSYSHQMPLLALTKALAARGHNLTVITTKPSKVQIANHTEIDISFSFDLLKNGKLKVKFQSKMNPFTVMIDCIDAMVQLTRAQIKSVQVQNFLHWAKDVKFDIVLYENIMGTPYLAMVHKLGSPPVVGLSSLEGNALVDYGTGSPANLAYAPAALPLSDHMTFIERLCNFIYYSFVVYYLERYAYPQHDKLISEVFGESVPRSKDLEFNISLMIHSSDNSMTYPQATTPNVKHVGPLHLVTPKPLPDALEKWVSGTEDGVIYFCMGSNMQSTSIPLETRKAFLEAFSMFLKHRVMWKWENDSVRDGQLKRNIQFIKWTPQQDLLAHPNVKLFITQCGLQSMQEAVHNAVPVICIPLYGDQLMHARKVEYTRLGRVLDFNLLTKDTIQTAINDVLVDPTYKQNMQRMSDISRSRMTTSVEEAVWWVEHVLQFNGASHLRPATIDLHWSQYFLLDIAAFIILTVTILLLVLYRFLKFVYSKYLTACNCFKLKQT